MKDNLKKYETDHINSPIARTAIPIACSLFFGLIAYVLSVNTSYACHQEGLTGERCGRTVSEEINSSIYFVYQTRLVDQTLIAFERSDDLGATWTTPPKIISSIPGGVRPSMTKDSFGGIYAAWAIEDIGMIYWTYSLDGGETWAPESAVAETDVHNVEIVVQRDSLENITVKIAVISDFVKELKYFTSNDLGANWSETIVVDRVEVGRAGVIQDDAEVKISYIQKTTRQILFVNESDGFQSSSLVYANANRSPIIFQTMVSSRPGTYYVVWSEIGDVPLLRVAKSQDSGATWEQLPDVDTGTRYNRPNAAARAVDAETDEIYITGIRAPELGINFMRSSDSGQTWSSPDQVGELCPDTGGLGCSWPRLSNVAGSNLVLTIGVHGQSINDPHHIYLTTSIDSGDTWSELQRHTGSCGEFPATIVGTNGDDKIVGGPGQDVIVGAGGDDFLIGSSGDDVLCGDEGRDICIGGIGTDIAMDCELTRGIP